MSAAPTPANPNHQPVRSTTGAIPTTSTQLLTLVRTLIGVARRLAETLATARSTETLLGFTRTFGTRDLALIMGRILRGLRLAEALEQRLLRTAHRIDNPCSRPYRPHAPSRRPQADQQPGTDLLAHLPTAQEIADQIRHRPIGAVLADICRDLGINRGHPVWEKVQFAIPFHGGNLVRFLEDTMRRPALLLEPTRRQPPTTAPAPTPATGPPLPA